MNPKEVDRTNTFFSIVYTKFEENAQNDFEKNFRCPIYTYIYIACICKRRIYMKGF